MASSIKILTVVGARPQFVKAAVVSRVLQGYPQLQETMVHTGQHFDDKMSNVFFRELGVPKPKYDLGISGGLHGEMTGRMLEAVEDTIINEKPDLVLVYGDTNSTLAAALAASKMCIRIAHVEAGLRSFDRRMPEEINRILTDRVSDILFCPTDTAVRNLENEGFRHTPAEVILSGDVMFDSILLNIKNAYLSLETAAQLPQPLGDFVLCTVHRAENTDDERRLIEIIGALEEIHKELPVIVLLHPRTRARLDNLGVSPRVTIIEPVGYLELLYLLDRCKLVMTDSGGLQKEAFFLKKCCITLRDSTEWTELVEHGVNFLVGSERETILRAFHDCLTREFDFNITPYGDGRAGEKIVAEFLSLT
jgi:UDP-GlcNAc3NAcA epimerase